MSNNKHKEGSLYLQKAGASLSTLRASRMEPSFRVIVAVCNEPPERLATIPLSRSACSPRICRVTPTYCSHVWKKNFSIHAASGY